MRGAPSRPLATAALAAAALALLLFVATRSREGAREPSSPPRPPPERTPGVTDPDAEPPAADPPQGGSAAGAAAGSDAPIPPAILLLRALDGDGTPVAGVRVALLAESDSAHTVASALTEEKAVELRVPPGRYELVALSRRPGYDLEPWTCTTSRVLDLRSGQLRLDLPLVPPTASLAVHIVDDTGQPCAGVSVSLTPDDQAAVTGADGVAILESLCAGRVEVEIHVEDTAWWEDNKSRVAWATLEAGLVTELTMVLLPRASLELRLDAGAVDGESAHAYLRPAGGVWRGRQQGHAHLVPGRSSIVEGLAPGEYRIDTEFDAMRECYAEPVEVHLRPGSRAQATITVVRSSRCERARVVGPDGSPVAAVWVEFGVVSRGREVTEKGSLTDDRGEVVVCGLGEGSVSLRILSHTLRGRPLAAPLTIRPIPPGSGNSGGEPVIIRLEPGFVLVVHARDVNAEGLVTGDPVMVQLVRIDDGWTRTGDADPSDEGRFEFGNLNAGEYLLRASSSRPGATAAEIPIRIGAGEDSEISIETRG